MDGKERRTNLEKNKEKLRKLPPGKLETALVRYVKQLLSQAKEEESAPPVTRRR